MSGQLGQAPEPGQNASFLHKDSTLKVVQSGTITLNKPANISLQSEGINHNLGYIPAFVAYLVDPQIGGIYYPLPYSNLDVYGAGDPSEGKVASNMILSAYTTNTAIVVLFSSNTNSGNVWYLDQQTFVVKYYLFAEEAN